MALLQLIHNLSPAEKRYLKQMVSESSERYFRLFEAVLRQEQGDEAALKQQFQQQGWFPNFSEAKRSLTNMLLRGLRRYHESRTPHFEVYNLLKEVEILFYKSMQQLAAKRLQQARDIAEEANLHEQLLLIQGWERRLQVYQLERGGPEQWRQALQTSLENLMKEYDRYSLQWQATNILRQYGYPAKNSPGVATLQQLEASLQTPAAGHASQDFFDQVAADYVRIIRCLMQDELEAAYAKVCQLVAQIDQVPPLFQAERVHTLANIFKHQMSLAEELNKYEATLAHSQVFERWINQAHLKQARVLLANYIDFTQIKHSLTAHRNLGHAAELAQWLQAGEHLLKRLPHNHEFHPFLSLNLSQSYLMLGQPRAAKLLLAGLQERQDLRPDMQHEILFFRLMAEFDLDNRDLADHLFTKAQRHLQKHQAPANHRQLLQHFRKLFYAADGRQRSAQLEAMQQDLATLMASSVPQQTASELRNYWYWVESWRRRQPPLQIIAEYQQRVAS
jgi:hypothetical protein